ncbi:hypothetical protein HK098_006325 [Nowakowskiella sp. JEL0407]|nr:hypothetical protein HK098_006325 [Nowakowskiella sp. JEL0407]
MKFITFAILLFISISLASGKRLFCNPDNSICVDSDLLDSKNATIEDPMNNPNMTAAKFVQFRVQASSRLGWWAFGINQGSAEGMDNLEIYSFERVDEHVNFTLRYAVTTKQPYDLTYSPGEITVNISTIRQPVPPLPVLPVGTPLASLLAPVTQYICTIKRPITFDELFPGTVPDQSDSVVVEFLSLSDWKTNKRNVAWAMGLGAFGYHGVNNRGFQKGLELF